MLLGITFQEKKNKLKAEIITFLRGSYTHQNLIQLLPQENVYYSTTRYTLMIYHNFDSMQLKHFLKE